MFTRRNIMLFVFGFLMLCGALLFGIYLCSTGVVGWSAFSFNTPNCFIAGGRQTDGLVAGQRTIEYAGSCNQDALNQPGGMPLQPFWEQVVGIGFNGNSTQAPSDFDITAAVKPGKFEIVNDGVQIVAIKKFFTWHYYILPREEGSVAFWNVSCMKLEGDSLVIYKHDLGNPGTFAGECSGDNITLEEYSGNPEDVADIAPYFSAIRALIEQTNLRKPPIEAPIYLNQIWFNN